MRQKRILLCLVEPMDLVDKEDGPLTIDRLTLLCSLDDGPQLGNAPCDRREGHELGLCIARDKMRQCRLPRARRPPKDDGGKLICFDRPSQRPIRRSNILLPDEVPKLSRPQTLGQWSLNGCPSLRGTKQIRSPIT